MTKNSKPRAGSLQFHPRKRAKSIRPRIRSWGAAQGVKPLGFAGFKAGMTHAFVVDNRKTETKGMEIFQACTIIEAPPITCYGARAYKNTPYGMKITAQVNTEKTEKSLARLIKPQKKPNTSNFDSLKNADEIRLLVYTQPEKVSAIPTKKPRLFELPVSGKVEEQRAYAIEHIGKDITISDVFTPGQYVDIQAVTTGKGTQGPVKRFGVKIRKRKHRVAKGRHIGTLGDRGTGTRWSVPQAGQMGFQQRCDQNKLILSVSDKPIKIDGGIPNYGEVTNQYLLIKGSIPGPKRRIVSLRAALRKPQAEKAPEVTYLSTASKQGR